MVFLLCLLLPAIITFASASIVQTPNEDTSVFVGLSTGGIAGIISGIMIGRRLGENAVARLFLSLLFIGLMSVVSITLACVGCSLGEYQLHLG